MKDGRPNPHDNKKYAIKMAKKHGNLEIIKLLLN
jgi:hypothetical protein